MVSRRRSHTKTVIALNLQTWILVVRHCPSSILCGVRRRRKEGRRGAASSLPRLSFKFSCHSCHSSSFFLFFTSPTPHKDPSFFLVSEVSRSRRRNTHIYIVPDTHHRQSVEHSSNVNQPSTVASHSLVGHLDTRFPDPHTRRKNLSTSTLIPPFRLSSFPTLRCTL